jgi:hypothetical protein
MWRDLSDFTRMILKRKVYYAPIGPSMGVTRITQ